MKGPERFRIIPHYLTAAAWILAACSADADRLIVIDPSNPGGTNGSRTFFINARMIGVGVGLDDAGEMITRAEEIAGQTQDSWDCVKKTDLSNPGLFDGPVIDKQDPPKLSKPPKNTKWVKVEMECWPKNDKNPTVAKPTQPAPTPPVLDAQKRLDTIYSDTTNTAKNVIDAILRALACLPAGGVTFFASYIVFRMIFGKKHNEREEQFWQGVYAQRAANEANDKERARMAPIKALAAAEKAAAEKARIDWEDACMEDRIERMDAYKKQRAEREESIRQKKAEQDAKDDVRYENWKQQKEEQQEQQQKEEPGQRYAPPKEEPKRKESESRSAEESSRIKTILKEALGIYQRDQRAGKTSSKIYHNVIRAIYPNKSSQDTAEEQEAREEAVKIVNNAFDAVSRRKTTFKEFLDDESGWFSVK